MQRNRFSGAAVGRIFGCFLPPAPSGDSLPMTTTTTISALSSPLTGWTATARRSMINPLSVEVAAADWQCKQCYDRNPADCPECMSCGYQVEVKAYEERWTCAGCKNTNTAEKQHCNICIWLKSDWKCPACSTRNTDEEVYCVHCDLERSEVTGEVETTRKTAKDSVDDAWGEEGDEIPDDEDGGVTASADDDGVLSSFLQDTEELGKETEAADVAALTQQSTTANEARVESQFTPIVLQDKRSDGTLEEEEEEENSAGQVPPSSNEASMKDGVNSVPPETSKGAAILDL